MTVSEDGTCSFVATEEICEVEAIYKRKIFVDGSGWDITKQYEGEVKLYGGGFQAVDFYDKYENMDITLTVKDSTIQTQYGTRRVKKVQRCKSLCTFLDGDML